MKTYAIGDIHGSHRALCALLDCVDLANDRLIFLGDYIDRGPDSQQVLETLIELSANSNHIFLRGNHDDWLLQARDENYWFKMWLGEGVGGKETLRSYGADVFDAAALARIPYAHFEFLERTRLFFETETEIFVHASLSWQEPENTDARQLMWRSFHDIVPHPSGKRVICGHTSQIIGWPLDHDYAVCIDTFCYGGGWLSALDVDTDEVIQTNSEGQIRKFSLRDVMNLKEKE